LSARLTPGFASLVSDELQPKGVISLRFCVASPGAGKRPTLDCHEVPWLMSNFSSRFGASEGLIGVGEGNEHEVVPGPYVEGVCLHGVLAIS
jgi:hypothetical protein